MNKKLNNNFSMRKLLLTALVAGPLATLPAPLWALPDITSANLTTSSGVTTQIVGSTLNVTSPDKAILTWQAFGNGGSPIAFGDTINYFLPSATSSVLNTVSGTGNTVINGSIISNGNVYVLNKSGIIISATAQINTGGFYASTVDEPSGFFSINGNLSFAGTSTSGVQVQGTGVTSSSGSTPGNVATIQAVGPGNNIYLAGNTVNVDGGKFFGNLFVRSSGTGTNATFGASGPVSVNLVGVPLVGGGLDIRTNGGNAVLSGVGSLMIAPSVSATTGAVSVNTTGTSINGTITQGAGAVTASTTGSVVTLNAGTGTGAAAITLGSVDFVTVGSTGSAIALNDTAGGIALNATTATGALSVTSAGAITQGTTGAHSVAGTVTLTQAAGSAVSFTGTGNLTFASFANNPATTTLLTSGDLTLVNLTASNALSITSSGGQITAGTITTSSTLTISATNAASGKLTADNIQSNTGTITVAGDIKVNTQLKNNGSATLAVTSSSGNITLAAVTASSTLNLTATAGSITQVGLMQTNTLNVTAANGTISLGSLSTGNGVSISGGTVSTGTISSTNTGFSITASTGNLTTGTISTNSNSTLTASAGSITTGTITSTSTLTLTATLGTITTGTISSSNTLTLSAPAAAGVISVGAINQTSTRNTTLTSGGSITLPAITGTNMNLFVTSTAGSISQTAATAITQTSGVVTLNAAGDISLPTLTNDFSTLVLLGGASATAAGANVVDANSIVLGTATNTLAPTKITTQTNGTITLGNAAIDTLNFGSTLTLIASGTGTIGTNANTVTVFGNVSLTTTNTTANLGQNIFGNAANYKFGQIQANVGTGALNIFENTTLNLGGITAGSLDARSLSSDVINTGVLAITGAAVTDKAIFSANSIFSPGSATINNASNNITVPVYIGNAANFTLVNAANTSVTAGTPLVNGKAGGGVTNITVTGGTNTLTLKTDIAGVQTGGDFNTVSFSAPGLVTITDPNTVTLQNVTNTGVGAVNVTTGRDSVGGGAGVLAGGPIVLGSGIVLGSTGVTTLTSNGLTAGITDSAPNIRISGNVVMVSDNSISITNAGHSLGAVSLSTTGANGANGTANITYTEGGSANLNLVRINTSASTTVPAGNLTVVSTGGDVIQTNVAAVVGPPAVAAIQGSIIVPTTGTGTNTVSFTSNNGGVALLNPAGTNAITPVITVSAVGNSTVNQAANITLGNVAVTGGFLSVDASTGAAATIGQATGTTIKAFGNPTFKTQGGKITLTNTGNNFGGVTATSNTGAAAGADIAITEAGTLNFVSVNTGTTGKLTAISEKAAIIQSGTLPIIVGGATSLTAADAGVTLNTSTTNTFGGLTNNGILVTTVGNVNIQDSAATTILNGASTIGGSLILKNSSIGGTIKDSPGTLTVSGNVLFDTSTAGAMTGVVSIGSSTASLGAIQFRSGTVTIVENATLNLNAGSVASGAVSLTSSGNIVTSGSGGGTFQNKLDLNASGSITITNPIFVNGASSTGPGLTFRALGAVDLSALSLAGNLNSIAPTNLGASSYKAPSP